MQETQLVIQEFHRDVCEVYPTMILRCNYIYTISQEAVDSDEELVSIYERIFEKLSIHGINSLCRTGRKLRNTDKIHKRSEYAEQRSRQQQEQFRNRYARK